MSTTAPWLALAVDFDESEMWDSLPQYGFAEPSTMGERLAWVCLMCDAKKKGRGGKVTIRKSVFKRDHRLTGRAVDGMLSRAQKCGAVEINGDLVTLCNWGAYQEKLGGKKYAKPPDSQGTALPITHHPSPPTKDQGQNTNTGRAPVRAFVKPTLAEVEAYCRERNRGVDAHKWFDHYESNGWKVGKNAMKDWRAAVRKWENSDYGNNSAKGQYGGKPPGAGQRFRG